MIEMQRDQWNNEIKQFNNWWNKKKEWNDSKEDKRRSWMNKQEEKWNNPLIDSTFML